MTSSSTFYNCVWAHVTNNRKVGLNNFGFMGWLIKIQQLQSNSCLTTDKNYTLIQTTTATMTTQHAHKERHSLFSKKESGALRLVFSLCLHLHHPCLIPSLPTAKCQLLSFSLKLSHQLHTVLGSFNRYYHNVTLINEY